MKVGACGGSRAGACGECHELSKGVRWCGGHGGSDGGASGGQGGGGFTACLHRSLTLLQRSSPTPADCLSTCVHPHLTPSMLPAGDWGRAWDIFEGVAPVEGGDEFPELGELLAWDPDAEEKESRRAREAALKVHAVLGWAVYSSSAVGRGCRLPAGLAPGWDPRCCENGSAAAGIRRGRLLCPLCHCLPCTQSRYTPPAGCATAPSLPAPRSLPPCPALPPSPPWPCRRCTPPAGCAA